MLCRRTVAASVFGCRLCTDHCNFVVCCSAAQVDGDAPENRDVKQELDVSG